MQDSIAVLTQLLLSLPFDIQPGEQKLIPYLYHIVLHLYQSEFIFMFYFSICLPLKLYNQAELGRFTLLIGLN